MKLLEKIDQATIKAIKGKKGTLVLQEIHSETYLKYLSVVFQICSNAASSTRILHVIDPSSNSCAECQNLQPEIARLLNFASGLRNLEYEKVELNKKSTKKFKSYTLLYKQNLRNILENKEMLRNSIRSVLGTDFYNSDSNFSLYGRASLRSVKLVKDYLYNFHTISEKLSSEDEFVLVFNGRYPEQVAVIDAALRNESTLVYLEHGQRKGINFHFNLFQTQDTSNLGKWIVDFQLQDSAKREQAMSLGEDFLKEVEVSSIRNPFLPSNSKKNFRVTKPVTPYEKNLLFCTSSLDERRSNLKDQKNGWESQLQALESLKETCLDQKFNLLVKIHPNALNKAWVDLNEISTFLIKNRIQTIWPWEQVSAFELLEHADVFSTWGSSVALSAVARGIPTFTLTETVFSRALSCPIYSPNSMQNINLSTIKVSGRRKALLAAGTFRNWGYALSEFSNTFVNATVERKSELRTESEFLMRTKRRLLTRLKLLKSLSLLRMSSPSHTFQFFRLFFFVPESVSKRGVMKIYLVCMVIKLRLKSRPSNQIRTQVRDR